MHESSNHRIIGSSPFLWLRRNFALILTLIAFALLLVIYISVTSDVPFGIKPKRVLRLLMISIALLLPMVCVVALRIIRLMRALRMGNEGSRLQKRILLLFGLVTIVPTIVVSVASAVFFNYGIQTWFNERVQKAVGESLAVAEAYLDEHKENIRGDAIAMAGDLNRVANLAVTDPDEFSRIVSAQAALRVLTEAIVFQGNHIIAQGPLSFALGFAPLPPDVLERAAKGEVVIMTAENDKVRALIRLTALNNAYLLVGRLIDSKVLAHMQNAQGAVSEYNTLRSQLERLQMVFSLVFMTLALLLLLAAIWYGMVFASRLTGPISRLVVAAERVRGGDFSVRVADPAAKDEIGTLSRAFNRMTEQLDAQRRELIEANRRLDERRHFSEAVLSGVSAGVIALDRAKCITLSNRSAGAILGGADQPLAPGTPVAELLPGIQELLAKAEQVAGGVVQDTLTVTRRGRTLTLHMRISAEQLGTAIEGFIVTFDDITLLVTAQRNAAWADVARRVAHEIKNPLTPIQLAAERLKRKYLKFITEDQDTFVKYTDTIARHVGDIGKMVEEFVLFARLPAPRFASEDLGALIKKAVFSAQVANPAIDYALESPDAPVMMHCDERQIMQVMTNLLKNASEGIEARLAAQPEGEKGRIGVALRYHGEEAKPTKPSTAGQKEGLDCFAPLAMTAVEIVIEDNGIGFPAGEQSQLLEPYVTTRTKGTGLGLAIVKKIIDDHKGLIKLENISSGGARVVLYFPQQCDINAAN